MKRKNNFFNNALTYEKIYKAYIKAKKAKDIKKMLLILR